MTFEEDEKNDNERNWISKEPSDEIKIILEKRKEVAPPKVIGGSRLSNENGVSVKKEEINFCVCGDMVEEDKILICQIGKELLCTGCALSFKNKKKVCVDCLQKEQPLTKREYKVLLCVSHGINNKRTINNLTKIPNGKTKETLASLCNSEYLEKRFMRPYKITDTGMDTIAIYSQVFDSETDVSLLIKEIKKSLVLQ